MGENTLKNEIIENYCRLCAQKRDTFDLINAFTVNGLSKLISVKVEAIFKIKITSNDCLPQSICFFCFSKLEEFYKFTKEVDKNQDKLRLLFPEPVKNSTSRVLMNLNTKTDDSIDVNLIEVLVEEPETHGSNLENQEEFEVIIEIEEVSDQQGDQLKLDQSVVVSKRSLDNKKKERKNCKKTTNDEKIFSCELCEKQYQTNTALGKHMEAVHKGVRWQCSVCDNDYAYKNDLTVHLRTVHGDREKTLCEICSAE